ncbi:glycerophosphodiester phosphodiesterase family protein [Hyphococcus sp.]|uniref:glycerophosphodiester phosphodiesterase family protein n=1 Tax=Hyphococcus sp. TaxID=2038636 RepID=UPI003CCBDC5A
MPKWLMAASFLALAACGDSVTNTDSQTAGAPAPGWRVDPQGGLNAFFDCLADNGATLISAHRGGPYPGYPENAVETMSAVLAATPAIMEIDVATSADGVLYLMHDDTLERTTTGEGAADGMSWAGLEKLRLEDNHGGRSDYAPSRFDDALAWAAGRTILQVDFKRTTRYEDVAEEIKRQGAEDRVILIAYSMASARKLHALLPDTMISLSLDSQSALNRAVASGVPDDRLLGFTGTQDPRPRLFSILNGRDVEVIFGTLGGGDSIDNDIARSGYEALYADIAEQGADIIATDRPHEAHAALVAAGRAVEDGECGVSLTGG